MKKTLSMLLAAFLMLCLLPLVSPPAHMITSAVVHVDKESAVVGEPIRWWVTDETDVEGVLNYHFAIYKDNSSIPYSPEPHFIGVIFAWRRIPERTWTPSEPGTYHAIVVIKDRVDADSMKFFPSDYTIVSATGAADKGDANGDNTVDIMDLVAIIDYIVSDNLPESMTNADANEDGTVDIMDLVWIIDQIVNG